METTYNTARYQQSSATRGKIAHRDPKPLWVQTGESLLRLRNIETIKSELHVDPSLQSSILRQTSFHAHASLNSPVDTSHESSLPSRGRDGCDRHHTSSLIGLSVGRNARAHRVAESSRGLGQQRTGVGSHKSPCIRAGWSRGGHRAMKNRYVMHMV
jgi:hypothetical protein